MAAAKARQGSISGGRKRKSQHAASTCYVTGVYW